MKVTDQLRSAYRSYVRPRKPLLFNEAVNPDQKAIFVAIPKTGTTGIRTQMRNPEAEYMVPWPHLNIRQIRDGLRTHAWMQALNVNRSFPTETAMVPSHDEIMARCDAFFASALKFSMVRNPWARVASIYARREGIPMSADMDFESFCLALRHASDTCRKPTRHDCQIDWLVDETGEIMVDHVMRLEELDAGLARIREMTDGRVNLQSREANVNRNSHSRSYRDRYSQRAREHVAAIFRRDIEAFGYAF